MGQTIAQKILAKKSGKGSVQSKEIVYVQPDLVTLYDWPGFDGLMRNIQIDPDRVAINIDHFFSPPSEIVAKLHRNFRATAAKYKIKKFYDIGQTGIGYQLFAEKGLVRPGMLVVHADPHVSTMGAFGAYSIGVGGDILAAFQSGEVWLKVPETLQVNVKGKFPAGVTSRDLFEKLVADLGPDGASGKVLEFRGPTIEDMTMESRMVLCNSVQYLSAETAIIAPDKTTMAYLRDKTRDSLEMIQGDEDAVYAQVLQYDVSNLEPMVVTPPDVFYVKTVMEVAGKKIDQALIGTCASGRLEDLRLAARILQGKKVHPTVRFMVTPITPQILSEASKEGLIEKLIQAGAMIGPSSCGSCYGGFGQLLPGETCLSTGTLNIPGRLGSVEAEIYMANPATVAASAIEGKITDPRKFL
jgi:3-isopropylmalate/(R)-2-methylmalate dehydratase large subunit